MHLRPKAMRRLLILGVLLVLGAAAGGTWWMVHRKTSARIAETRENAMAAFAKEDYANALPFFSDYLTLSKTAEKAPGEADVEALLAYGKSRLAIPLPKGRHFIESIKIFELYLRLKPGDREAEHLLLELYPQVKYNEEALNLANRVLQADPNDAPALRAKVAAYTAQRKFKEALAASDELVRVLPTDLNAHRNRQSIMLSLERPVDQIVAEYEALLSAHSDDPRFELLLALAYHFANDPEHATHWLKTAAGRKPVDPETAQLLTGMLEQYDLFRESNIVLEQLASADNDAIHLRPLVRRLWQSSRYKDVLKRTDNLDPASPSSDSDLLAYRALALYDLNRPTDAAVIVDTLAARKDDMAAVAWATTLRTRENENMAPRERVRQYREMLERAPNNEVIHFFLGEAYLSLGEPEPALASWRQAAQLAPSWPAPPAAISRTLAQTGRSAEALDAAREAYQRSPRSVSSVVGFAVAWFADQQQNPDPQEQRRLLEMVQKIQEQIPGEPETLHIYAALLSRTGQRDKAIEVIKSAIAPRSADVPAPPRDTLLSLASVSYIERLGLEGQVLEFAEKSYGLTPPVAIRKAVLLSQAGKPKEGLKLLQAARQADAKSDPTQWALAILQYRESIDDENVLAEWISLGDTNPENAQVQSAILRSPSRTKDRAFWNRTIDRLKKLTGDEAITPRVERARWLLAGDPTEKEASEAILLLSAVDRAVSSSLPEIHRLAGIAREKNAAHKTGFARDELLRTAAAELQLAFSSRNADASVATDLARVYRALNRVPDAEKVMSTFAERAAELGIDGQKRTARALISQGQLQKAIEVLEPMGDGKDSARDAMLCSLYRRTGANEKAAAQYRKAMADSRVEPTTIADGADFFASHQNAAEAQKFLDKLRSMDVGAAERELLLARYAERHLTPDDALKGYEAAVKADPTHPAAWQGLVGFYLRRMQFLDAAAAADRGLKSIPDDRTLQSLRARAMALRSYSRDSNLQTLASELSNDPQSGAITDMLRILAEANQNKEPLEQTVPRLRELADRNPDFVRLQMYVAQAYAKLGQYDEAERVAVRAAQTAPNDPESARVLTLVCAARPGAEKWTRVLDSARQWRLRSLENPKAADIAIGRTLLEMNRPAEASEQVKPHVPPTLDANSDANAVEIYGLGLLRTGNEKSISSLLLPAAKESATWRRVWLNLARDGFDNPDTAMRWIEQIVPRISTTDLHEQVALAESWSAVGTRFNARPAFEKAIAVIEPLTREATVSAEGWRLMAMVGESMGDMPRAINAYRELLKTSPDNADIRNNLAFALLQQGQSKDLPEARQLAEGAISQQPGNASFLDTLARVQLQSGDLAAAEQNFSKALSARGGSLEAMIGLADVHARAGRTDKARELLLRINDALQPGSQLPVNLQRQLDSVRQSVIRPVQSGRIE